MFYWLTSIKKKKIYHLIWANISIFCSVQKQIQIQAIERMQSSLILDHCSVQTKSSYKFQPFSCFLGKVEQFSEILHPLFMQFVYYSYKRACFILLYSCYDVPAVSAFYMFLMLLNSFTISSSYHNNAQQKIMLNV